MSLYVPNSGFTKSSLPLDGPPYAQVWSGAAPVQQHPQADVTQKFDVLLERATNIELRQKGGGLAGKAGTSRDGEKASAEPIMQATRFEDQVEKDDRRLEELFEQFVAQTFFGLLLKEMRKSVHKTPYFHGGLAEQIFEQHLDMTIAEKLGHSTRERFGGPMFELFQLQQKMK